MPKRKRATRRRKSGSRSVATTQQPPSIAALERDMQVADLAMQVAADIAPRWFR